MSKALLSLKL